MKKSLVKIQFLKQYNTCLKKDRYTLPLKTMINELESKGDGDKYETSK